MDRTKKTSDAVIIGAGIMGAAVARALLQKKRVQSVILLEKEKEPASHTSGRNSGVAHSGFNLKPGSHKATFCVKGNDLLESYCSQHNVPFKRVGTLVVARNEQEVPILEELLIRAQKNNVQSARIIDEPELKKSEPYAIGIKALLSPRGGVVEGRLLTLAVMNEVKQMGGELYTGQKVQGIQQKGSSYVVETSTLSIETPLLINCAGLYADKIAHMIDVGRNYKIIPFRGRYFELIPEKRNVVQSMIYPVPDLKYPFLGVHWTRTVDGGLIIGPNASLAFGKESYRPLDIHFSESIDMFMSKNFWKLWGNDEFRMMAKQQLVQAFSRKHFIREAMKLVKDVSETDFVEGRAGNRAQVVDNSGKMIEDILVEKKDNSVHVLNAVSPGLTCSLPFGEYIVDTYV